MNTQTQKQNLTTRPNQSIDSRYYLKTLKITENTLIFNLINILVVYNP